MQSLIIDILWSTGFAYHAHVRIKILIPERLIVFCDRCFRLANSEVGWNSATWLIIIIIYYFKLELSYLDHHMVTMICAKKIHAEVVEAKLITCNSKLLCSTWQKYNGNYSHFIAVYFVKWSTSSNGQNYKSPRQLSSNSHS